MSLALRTSSFTAPDVVSNHWYRTPIPCWEAVFDPLPVKCVYEESSNDVVDYTNDLASITHGLLIFRPLSQMLSKRKIRGAT